MNEPIFWPSEDPNPLLRTDVQGHLLYANPAANPLVEALQLQPGTLLPVDWLAQIRLAQTTRSAVDMDVTLSSHVYTLRFVFIHERAYINIYGFDVTSKQHLQMEVHHLSYFDDLTHLANRNQFIQQILTTLQELQENQSVAVLAIDIDNFKSINHTYGHLIADQLLIAVADRLAECIPIRYFLARIADDEFGVIRPNLQDVAEAAMLAQVIIDNLAVPFWIDGNEILCTVAIGIASAPHDAYTAATLLQRARVALADGQRASGNRYQFYQAHMGEVAAARHHLLHDMHYGLSEAQFVLYYQPQIALMTEAVVGVEALVRWQHPYYGLVTPSRFTSLAEESGLILDIGRWVLREACRQWQRWSKQGGANLTIAINVSPLQLEQGDLVSDVQEILEETGIPAQVVELEITENVLIKQFEATKAVLERLAQLGVRIAIDDFGTGFSSLNYLHQLPIHKLKIDRSFIHELSKSPQQRQAILESIIQLAHALQLDIVAEGIEDHAQLQYLREHQCHYGQGYYFSQPLPANKFMRLLQNQPRK